MAWPRLWPSHDRAELKRLRESEARYRLLAEHASDLIVQYDLEGVVQYVSPSIAALGFRPEQVVGRTVFDLGHPDDRPKLRARLAAVASGRTLSEAERGDLRLLRPDGSYAWIQGRPAPIRDAAGRVVGVVSVLRDISERRALEERVRHSESRYRVLAEGVRDIIVHYDLDGVIAYASPSVAIMGYQPDEVVGRNILDFAHPDEVAFSTRRLAALHDNLELPRGSENEIRLRCRDGSWLWLQGNPAPLHDEAGNATGIVTTLRDITDRRALEEQLRESEARYRVLAEHSPDVIIRYDIDGLIEYISPAIRRHGIEPESLIGRNAGAMVASEESERNDQFMADLAAGRPLPQGRQNVWRTPMGKGRIVYWEGATTPLVEDGKVVGAMSVLRDVTERVALEAEIDRKRAETEEAMARLTDSEARYRALADNASDVIIRSSMKDVIEFASPSVRSLGYAPEDLVGRRGSDFVHPDDIDGSTRAAILAGRPLPSGADNEYRLRCADGHWAWVQGNPALIRDEKGEVVGVVSVLRDVTERRRLEDELRRKEADAQAAVVAKSEFLANMSHEIRTPLTAVVGFAGLLAKMAGGLPEKGRVYVDRIAKSGEALTSIVNNVLDFSKIEAGHIELKPEPFDLQALADEALGVVQEVATAKGLTLTAEVVGDPPGLLLADAGRLRQVLLNLLTNAIKFTHQGEVAVELAYDAAASRLHVAVKDTGIGIAAEAASRLFQRFSQVESSNARRFGGAGLGLAISRGLVELMHGEIGVDSLEGAGSTFWFAVPAPLAHAAARPSEPEPAPSTAGARILVVDDARANRELIMALLGPFKPRLTEARDGLEALEATKRERFDLVLMDLQMPGMDGMAAARAIRAGCDLNRGTPILAVSASVQPSDVEACRLAGMDDHIPKPINARELAGKVAHWTNAPQGPGAARAMG